MKTGQLRYSRFAASLLACIAALSLSGCAVVTVAATAVSVAGTAVNAGLTVGAAAVGVTASAVKGAVSLASDSPSE